VKGNSGKEHLNYAFFFGFFDLPSLLPPSLTLRFAPVLLDFSGAEDVAFPFPFTLTTVDMPCLREGSALLNAWTCASASVKSVPSSMANLGSPVQVNTVQNR